MDNIDFGSDSDDQSDEDYCPLKEKTDVLSEEESGNESNSSGDEHEEKSKTAKQRKKPANLASRKRKAPREANDDPETVKDVAESTKETELDEKSHADALWASFLGDTDAKKSVKATPEPAVKKQLVTETLEFAGEKIEIVKEVVVPKNPRIPSKESSLFDITPSSKPENDLVPGRSNGASAPPAGPTQRRFGGGMAPSGGGLLSIVGQIGKKNKIGVLEKTAMDWKKFKTVEGIDEQLKNHNKGKDGYLERQDFLQRADLRQFEIEKQMRTVQRSKR